MICYGKACWIFRVGIWGLPVDFPLNQFEDSLNLALPQEGDSLHIIMEFCERGSCRVQLPLLLLQSGHAGDLSQHLRSCHQGLEERQCFGCFPGNFDLPYLPYPLLYWSSMITSIYLWSGAHCLEIFAADWLRSAVATPKQEWDTSVSRSTCRNILVYFILSIYVHVPS